MSVVLEQGIIKSLEINGHHYAFHAQPAFAGPVFHVVYGGHTHTDIATRMDSEGFYSLSFWGVRMSQRVEETKNGLCMLVRMKNGSSQPFRPDRISLMLGIDTYMDEYPFWNEKVFPTMLRCEKTHLWGYFRSPNGKILGIACPNPVASWALEYNQSFSDNGHRVYTVRLDLLSGEPQPHRHPHLNMLMPGEIQEWKITLFDVSSLEQAIRGCAEICNAPLFYPRKLILEPGETEEICIFAKEKPSLFPEFPLRNMGEGKWLASLPKETQPGQYTIKARMNNHESELIYCYRQPWSFYMNGARQAAWDMPQKTGSHAESWYGFFSAFQAARYMPQPQMDKKLLAAFDDMLKIAFDPDQGIPTCFAGRIQNTAIAASLCEDAWRMSGNIVWLQRAAALADYLIDHCQRDDGAFLGWGHHYTCVIYIAKSILEVYLAENELKSDLWLGRAEKHFAGAKRAIDELVLHLDDIGTEGEGTFEDGMISCSMSQIAMMGLLLPEKERTPYIKAAEYMLEKHRCLERMGSTDARSRNTTLRFWEAQYDVLIPANMLNSPHGWSAWKVYGVWYLYLLTGKADYLEDAMETLGSCAQLMDDQGHLRWSFIPDPCIHGGLWLPDGKGKGYLKKCIFGETYLDMISGWYRAPQGVGVYGYLADNHEFETDEGGCCDNDVHECFKAMAEAALPYGYIYEGEQGPRVFNGTLNTQQEVWEFIPGESLVRAVHCNFNIPRKIRVLFDVPREAVIRQGWLYADGHVGQDLPEGF